MFFLYTHLDHILNTVYFVLHLNIMIPFSGRVRWHQVVLIVCISPPSPLSCVRCQHFPADGCLISVLGDFSLTLYLLSNTGYRPSGAARKPHSLRACDQEITHVVCLFSWHHQDRISELQPDSRQTFYTVFKSLYINLWLISHYLLKTWQIIIHQIIPIHNLVTC